MAKNFKVVVTNTETGDVIVNETTDCIIGSIKTENGTATMAFIDTNMERTFETVTGTFRALSVVFKTFPALIYIAKGMGETFLEEATRGVFGEEE